MRLVLLALLAAACPLVADAQQSRDPRVPVAGTAVLRGRVVTADTGMPLRRAIVQLVGAPQERRLSPTAVEITGSSPRRSVYTDDDGRYEFVGIPPGAYTVMVNPGIHRASYRGASTLAAAVPEVGFIRGPGSIHLGAGETRSGLDFALPRGGVITGRVVDSLGEPTSRISVSALLLNAGGEPTTASTALTDDRGVFRLYGLQEGHYIVATEARVASGGSAEVEGERLGFARTFAPGSNRRDAAARVRVAAGVEVAADIRLIETPVFDLSGTVLSYTGEPISGASISFSSVDNAVSTGTAIEKDGRFQLRGLTPGEYHAVVNYTPPAPPSGAGTKPRTPEFILTRIQVASDVNDLVLVTSRGETFTGTIRFDEHPPASRSVLVGLHPGERRPYTLTPRVQVKGDTFIAEGVFGSALIRGTAVDRSATDGRVDAQRPWFLKAVLLDGRDITDVPTVFTAAHDGRVEVVFSRTAATLEVTITDDSGRAAADGTLVIFGEDEDSWLLSSSRTRVGNLAGRPSGLLTIPGLRAGRYYVVAIRERLTTPSTGVSRELLTELKGVATPVVLNDGETRKIELRLSSPSR